MRRCAYFGNNLGTVLRQARETGIKAKILSVYESEDPSVLEVAGSTAEGLEFFVPESDIDTPERRAYRERFRDGILVIV